MVPQMHVYEKPPIEKEKQPVVEMTPEEVAMMRLINQATAQGLVMAQHYQTREIMLFAPTGEVHRHPDISLVRGWLRHYAECGRYGRRCFNQTGFKCPVVPVLTPSYHSGFFNSQR
jgi:hypothetical protein